MFGALLTRRPLLAVFLIGQLGLGLAGCARDSASHNQSQQRAAARAAQIIGGFRERLVPDPHMSLFDVDVEASGTDLVLTGEISDANALGAIVSELKKETIEFRNEVKVLPTAELGDRTWGIVSLSIANGRERPDHKAELGTQGLMGRRVRILKERRHWVFAQTEDRYLSWMEAGAITRCTAVEAQAWQNSALLIVTNYESPVLQQAKENAEPVSDVVMGNLVKQIGEEGEFWRVSLPDDRTGFLQKSAGENYASWKKSRQPTAANIEQTARMFLGRPYLWGGNSPKAVDCSGFCKLVFLMNGIELNRNASEQALQGSEVRIDDSLSALRKGDLLFFGARGRSSAASNNQWITHAAIYLGQRKYIQSSERVRISSFDPQAPDYDEFHGRSLLLARRVLAENSKQEWRNSK